MCLIWGSTFLAIRIGNETVAPLWAATLRLAIAAVLLAAIMLATRTPFPRGAALKGAVLFGFFNFGINFSLLYWGQLRVPSGVAAIFYATLPLSSGILAWWMGVHPLDPTRTVAAVIGLAGVAVIFAGELAIGSPPVALLAVFLAALSAALSGVFLKRAPAQPAIPANAVGALVGLPFCLAASLIAGEPRALPSTAAGWWPILYLAVAGNLGAFVLWSWLVTQWKLTTVTTGALITPVIAVVLGAAVKGESLAPGTYLGALLVLGAVGETLWLARMGGEGAGSGATGVEGTGPPHARILAPPPLVFLATIGAGLWITRAVPAPWLPSAPAKPLAVAALVAGGAIALSALAAFRRARTTFLPYRPSAAIVTDGPFRITRNPLYLSLALAHLAGAFWWNSLWLLALLPVLVLAMNRLVIRPEEEYLGARFGEAYREYRARVRRWI
jgi:drug/metabolite transporter (DMT)-like permease/protein-S-isoprenylcysteine O-methyltransferase Ste14